MPALRPLLCLLFVCVARVWASVVATASIGNQGAGQEQSFYSISAHATVFGVRWDGDKVRGVGITLSDGTHRTMGDYGNTDYALTSYTFSKGETLVTAYLRDSGYGDRSLRQVEFTTSLGHHFFAGASGFDNEVSLNVNGAFIAGFQAWVNSDNFINAFLFMVNKPAPPPPAQPVPWFETAVIGNEGAANTEVQFASNTSTARYFAVRWDGDKVRGVSLTLQDGTTMSAGGFGDVDYTLTSFDFTQAETLSSLSLSTSGYGYQSLRQLSYQTSTGRSFAAGPQGIDDLLQPPVNGSKIVGFHAWVNVDNFINAFAFRLTNAAPFVVDFHDLSNFNASFHDGHIYVDSMPLIAVTEVQGFQSPVQGSFQRGVLIGPSTTGGYCAFDGAATLKVAVFGDGTFEAHFGKDGNGSAAGILPGLPGVTDELTLIEALVLKYAPIQMINVDEVYWQSTIDDFLPHMIVEKLTWNLNIPNPYPFYTGPLDRTLLPQQAIALGSNNTANGSCLRTSADLNSPSDTQDWFNSARPGPNGVTSYAVVSRGQNGFLDITYWWFFNYNQGKTIAGTSWDNHVSDWEHVRVSLSGVGFENPGSETIYKAMLSHHDSTPVFSPDQCEFYGTQLLAHLANGDHEIYKNAGTYDTPLGSHDYCKTNPYEFDQRLGTIEIYLWNETSLDFDHPPAGAPAAYKDPSWTEYAGIWGNSQRGDLFGLTAQLSDGVEGIKRQLEHPTPSA